MQNEELIGQEVETVAVFRTRWRIAEVYEGVDGIMYARLRRRGEESSLKTLALKTVMDRRRYSWGGRKGH
ncbi:hypothetical protein EDC65_5135 [Stella humosa]|uniref:Uncharacterized protein n=1 Tax=Stella humosa TaxID=94 RepID=A0A3N1KR62_9PROT|nr:hypothetical protein [Stella humosa]ROP81279.1 hypothetical protein EDC65_5135 [Stella humosa]BBK32628.1 hypothetical protein STHU_32620 [Stella humosa]